MPVDGTTYATLSTMITPAIFLTANGSLIISTSNRMSRIVDRLRILNELGDKLDREPNDLDFSQERMTHVHDQVRRILWRSDRIRLALVMLYLAFGLFVGTSLVLAVDVWVARSLAAIPTGLAVLGVCFMLGACVNLVREALEALQGNRLEAAFYVHLLNRRASARLQSAPDRKDKI